MCPDSPAPEDSLWSSGENHINYTNFAAESLLDSRRCCIKVESERDLNSSSSSWKGEDCQSVLKGVCQFRVEEYLDAPSSVSAVSESPSSLNVSWGTEGLHWQPDSFSVSACHLKSLSPASLPVAEEDRCVTVNATEEEGREMMLDGLRSFAEYEVEVEGSLGAFQERKRAVVKARTREFKMFSPKDACCSCSYCL